MTKISSNDKVMESSGYIHGVQGVGSKMISPSHPTEKDMTKTVASLAGPPEAAMDRNRTDDSATTGEDGGTVMTSSAFAPTDAYGTESERKADSNGTAESVGGMASNENTIGKKRAELMPVVRNQPE
jgi:hypothetical protein